jgi:hypothetical protein
MKWMKRISIWIVVSLAIQGSVLFYLDHYFLATDSEVVSKKVEEDVEDKVKNIDIIVPENAENISVSYDAKYLSYYENDKLKIVDCKDGSIKDVDGEMETEISFYEWLPDRNRVLLVEKKSDDESSNLVLYSYDVTKEKKVKIKDLAWADTKAGVQDIEISILTGLTYVRVASNSGKSSIYRIDRMGTMTKTTTVPNFISNIGLVRHKDKLVYEGLVYNTIYVTGQYQPIKIKDTDKLTLIGTDDNDNVYIGELEDDKISKIYYGETLDDTEDWKTVKLQTPAEKNELFVSEDSKVYQNDALRGVIKQINSGTQTSYQGKFLQLYTKGIVSLIGNKISFVPFK